MTVADVQLGAWVPTYVGICPWMDGVSDPRTGGAHPLIMEMRTRG